MPTVTLLIVAAPLVVTAPLVAAAASACAAAVAGPASRFARDYVAGFMAGAEQAGDDPPPVVRRRALLGAGPQTALAASACATTALWALVHHRWVDGLVAVPVVALLVVAGSVDAVCHRLPNRLLGAAAAWLGAALIGRAVAALVAGATASRAGAPPARAALCALGLGGAALILALLPSGLGMGDVKLCALIGLWLGPLGRDVALSGALAGVILAGLSALVLMAARVVGRRQMIAMGPYLIVGAWLAWLLAVGAGA